MSEILDYFLIVAFLLIFTISLFASNLILTKFDEATTDEQINQTILAKGQDILQVFDLGMAFLLIGFACALFVTSMLVDSHPIFLPFNILVYIILIYVAGIFSNTAMAFAESPAIIAEANKYENVIYVWRNMPMILTILAGINIIVMFAKITRRRAGT